jgi:hypothetical protein
MRQLNEAWSVLRDTARRSALDEATGSAATPSKGRTAMTRDSDRPFWTGAAGPPPGHPSGPVLDFGIYAGWSLGEIARRDRGYLMWLRDRAEARSIRSEVLRLIDPNGAEPEEPRRGRR